MQNPERTSPEPPEIGGGFFANEFMPALLNQAMNLLNERFKAALKPHGISISQWRTLAALTYADDLSLTEIVRLTAIGQTTLSRVVDGLAGKGLVRTAPRAADGRFVAIRLTDAGRALVDGVWPTAWSHSEDAVAGWDEGERADLHRLLRKLVAGLQGKE
ncbi:MarR family winged helix-turn-helix transcriptional regulator [Amycolatopsis sp. NPDC051903]|uniref:MarR family winged helix-turn-helix transcriptional regulator n=1 Tax=Amycolatopsis sp. NPDC051903 TaxID=3363936 RepID=UPI0037AB18B9